MLKIINLHKDFMGIKALNGADFTIDKNSITALIGPNGSGKTTTLNLITGYIKPDSGRVLFENRNITGLSPDNVSNSGISRTFQLIRLFPKMTVMENMLLAMKDPGETVLNSLIRTRKSRLREKENENKAYELLKFVNLHVKVNELAQNLSYGQQKLLEIARALASNPKLLLLDEPAAGVNPVMLKKISGLMLDLKKRGITILFIEHDMEFVMNLADKIVVLDYGEEIAVGKPAEIRKNKMVIDAYLGATK